MGSKHSTGASLHKPPEMVTGGFDTCYLSSTLIGQQGRHYSKSEIALSMCNSSEANVLCNGSSKCFGKKNLLENEEGRDFFRNRL